MVRSNRSPDGEVSFRSNCKRETPIVYAANLLSTDILRGFKVRKDLIVGRGFSAGNLQNIQHHEIGRCSVSVYISKVAFRRLLIVPIEVLKNVTE